MPLRAAFPVLLFFGFFVKCWEEVRKIIPRTLLFVVRPTLGSLQCSHRCFLEHLFPKSGLYTSPAYAGLYRCERLLRYFLRSFRSNIRGFVSAFACVLPSSVHARTRHPQKWRYGISGSLYQGSRGAACRSVCIGSRDAIGALLKAPPLFLALGGHETFV